ncbi:MAG TPA: glycosyltransferase family 4 protein [Fimbriimonadaceae bacterium]|nr:glycosyltransferase family 4 protein [Fimbriimonadaceae bacterium]
MRVVFCIRPDWQSSHGGDVVQLLETKSALEARHGITCQIAVDPDDPALAASDLVHAFNVQTAELSLAFARKAKELSKPLALSTIYWDLSHARFVETAFGARLVASSPAVSALKPGFDKLTRISARVIGRPRYVSPSRLAQVRELVSLADVILPNSREEAELLLRDCGLGAHPHQVVVNATNLANFSPPTEPGARSGVVMAGRIQPIKNQLAVAVALRGSGVPATFVGASTDPRYVSALRRAREGEPGEVIDRSVPQVELAALYRGAEVHVLPSFRESPGLSTLEALSSGCKAVVSDSRFCPVGTYFEDLIGKTVFVCDPYSVRSVREAITQALAAPLPSPAEVGSIRRFTWDLAADQTCEAYRRIMRAEAPGDPVANGIA